MRWALTSNARRRHNLEAPNKNSHLGEMGSSEGRVDHLQFQGLGGASLSPLEAGVVALGLAGVAPWSLLPDPGNQSSDPSTSASLQQLCRVEPGWEGVADLLQLVSVGRVICIQFAFSTFVNFDKPPASPASQGLASVRPAYRSFVGVMGVASVTLCQ